MACVEEDGLRSERMSLAASTFAGRSRVGGELRSIRGTRRSTVESDGKSQLGEEPNSILRSEYASIN